MRRFDGFSLRQQECGILNSTSRRKRVILFEAGFAAVVTMAATLWVI
jgi:hypothetical protein